ncbi:transposable element Tcb2 transposase [Trichonephila clavipes]|nr:transposable element Tcb2 transposase [Trichonephila clavipes]
MSSCDSFSGERIICMMEAGWLAKRVARQLDRSDCVVPAVCWDQWIRDMSFTRRPGSGRPRQTSRREDRHIAAPVSSRTIRTRLAEEHLGSRHPLRVLPLTPSPRCLRLHWYSARGNWSSAEWNQVVFSDESRFNLSSDDHRVRVLKSRGERFNSAFSVL